MSDENVILCRCSDVSRDEVHHLIDKGLTTIEELKRICRCTMGPCQGRTCRQLITQEIAAKTGKPVSEIDPPKFRQPLKGVTLGAVAKGEFEDEKDR
ncbi:MAG: (2Fe-2S)-binding protein [Bacillota bacterium]